MAHSVNLLDGMHGYPSIQHGVMVDRWRIVAPEDVVTAAPINDTAAYMDGWSMVAQATDEDEVACLWLLVDAEGGAIDDLHRGIIDGCIAAYGEMAS